MYHVVLHVTAYTYQDILLVGSPLTHSSISDLDSIAEQTFPHHPQAISSRYRFKPFTIVGIFGISSKQWPHSLPRHQAGNTTSPI